MTDSATPLRPGEHVAELQINAVLGRNSRDVSYLVTDPALGTQFVLREYLPSALVRRDQQNALTPVNGPSGQLFHNGLKSFLDEARLAAALDHPNLARVLRYFEANGTAYFLMPYYKGETLKAKLGTGAKLDREQAKALLLPLMDGLAQLHASGIVHQAIRPSNIMLESNQNPILLDFRQATGISDDASLTRAMEESPCTAPEQLNSQGTVGPWTDIYSLSACLYEAIRGEPPPLASLRNAAIANGEADPLAPFSTLDDPARYGAVGDSIDQGLGLDYQQRPNDANHWRKTFSSLDWHRSVVVSGDTGANKAEKNEKLPAILLGAFITVMVVIAIVLMSDWSPDRFPVTREDVSRTQAPATSRQPEAPRADSEERKRWQATLEADTIEGYRRFIADYPESIYIDQAQIQLNILDERHWAELASEDSIAAYERYLELFPAGIHQATALQRIEAIQQEEARKERQRLAREQQERAAWEKASNARTMAAMDRYIKDWPAGTHIEEAKRIRRLLQDQSNDDEAFQTASNLNRIEAFQAYIDAFPRGAHVTAALQNIDDLTLRPGKTFRDCEQCPEMMVIPPGSYWQGASDESEMALDMEKPRRRVTIEAPMAVSIHEVTMAQWDRCYADGGCESRPEDNDWGRGDRPVIMVSWNDAQSYIRWISETTGNTYRLPSESEWEYFARAGEDSEWPGGKPSSACEFGNIAGAETGFRWQHVDCSDKLAVGTATVGSFDANAFGLHDTTGNVSEWTADCMNLSYLDAPVDGSSWNRGICSSHITRGGSWITGTRDIRLSARFNLKNGDRNDFTGFRVVREIDQ